MIPKKYTIGVVGHTGAVGSVVASYFRKQGHYVIGISSKSGQDLGDNGAKLKKADIIFVCVPTPFFYKTRTPDMTIVRDVVLRLPPATVVVIKSTVLPQTTESLQKLRPDIKILFNPEFLSRKTARQDFEKPNRQIVGYTKQSKPVARKILSLLPRGEYNVLMLSTEAELVKYMHNIFGALFVTFANHFYDVSEAMNVDYRKISDAFTAAQNLRGLRRYTTIYHNGKRGFGGSCFPKDINSFLVFCKKIGVRAELIEAARDANRKTLASQGMTEESAEQY